MANNKADVIGWSIYNRATHMLATFDRHIDEHCVWVREVLTEVKKTLTVSEIHLLPKTPSEKQRKQDRQVTHDRGGRCTSHVRGSAATAAEDNSRGIPDGSSTTWHVKGQKLFADNGDNLQQMSHSRSFNKSQASSTDESIQSSLSFALAPPLSFDFSSSSTSSCEDGNTELQSSRLPTTSHRGGKTRKLQRPVAKSPGHCFVSMGVQTSPVEFKEKTSTQFVVCERRVSAAVQTDSAFVLSVRESDCLNGKPRSTVYPDASIFPSLSQSNINEESSLAELHRSVSVNAIPVHESDSCLSLAAMQSLGSMHADVGFFPALRPVVSGGSDSSGHCSDAVLCGASEEYGAVAYKTPPKSCCDRDSLDLCEQSLLSTVKRADDSAVFSCRNVEAIVTIIQPSLTPNGTEKLENEPYKYDGNIKLKTLNDGKPGSNIVMNCKLPQPSKAPSKAVQSNSKLNRWTTASKLNIDDTSSDEEEICRVDDAKHKVVKVKLQTLVSSQESMNMSGIVTLSGQEVDLEKDFKVDSDLETVGTQQHVPTKIKVPNAYRKRSSARPSIAGGTSTCGIRVLRGSNGSNTTPIPGVPRHSSSSRKSLSRGAVQPGPRVSVGRKSLSKRRSLAVREKCHPTTKMSRPAAWLLSATKLSKNKSVKKTSSVKASQVATPQHTVEDQRPATLSRPLLRSSGSVRGAAASSKLAPSNSVTSTSSTRSKIQRLQSFFSPRSQAATGGVTQAATGGVTQAATGGVTQTQLQSAASGMPPPRTALVLCSFKKSRKDEAVANVNRTPSCSQQATTSIKQSTFTQCFNSPKRSSVLQQCETVSKYQQTQRVKQTRQLTNVKIKNTVRKSIERPAAQLPSTSVTAAVKQTPAKRGLFHRLQERMKPSTAVHQTHVEQATNPANAPQQKRSADSPVKSQRSLRSRFQKSRPELRNQDVQSSVKETVRTVPNVAAATAPNCPSETFMVPSVCHPGAGVVAMSNSNAVAIVDCNSLAVAELSVCFGNDTCETTQSNNYDIENYDISDIQSDDSTDDEMAPKKKVPTWAEGNRLMSTLIYFSYHPLNVVELFGRIYPPDLNKMFDVKKPRFDKRTSSANWELPPSAILQLHHPF